MQKCRFEVSGRATTGIASRLLLRIERERDDFIVSPLLGEGRLCEACWVSRRTATLDPAELRGGPSTPAELMAAFQERNARPGRPERPEQRATMAQILRERRQEVRRAEAACFPPVLSRVSPSGAAIMEAVLPLPDCKLCGNGTSIGFSEGPDLVVARTAGIIVELQEVQAFEGEPAFPHVVVSRLANTFLDWDRAFWSGASGKGATLDAAFHSAVGESLERYAARIVSQPLVHGRAQDLDAAIHPHRLTGVDCAQAKAAGYPADGDIAWVQGTRIRDRKSTNWLPASAVYLRLPPECRAGLAVPHVSNGLACAPTLEQAIERARAEVVERHVFFSVWYGARAPELPNAERFIDDFAACETFRASGLELRTALLTANHCDLAVASASCWPHDEVPIRPSFAIGLGVDATPTSAVRRAILEVAQVYRGLTWALRNPILRKRAEQVKCEPSFVNEPYDHALLYAGRSPRAVPSPFGLGLPRAVDARGPDSETLCDNALFVDLTPRDMAAATGWRVARVVVPDALPCHFGVNMIPHAMLCCSPISKASSTDLLHPLP
jgi:thiazole/oxazole-forming peptide maturase SagD family component